MQTPHRDQRLSEGGERQEAPEDFILFYEINELHPNETGSRSTLPDVVVKFQHYDYK